jgi:hypothetical protein
MEHLVGGHVWKQEAQDLPRIEILGNVNCTGLRHTDPLRVGSPNRQRPDAISLPQSRATRPQFLDDADELVAGRERRLRRASDICAGAQLRIGERHPRSENPDADLARTRSGIVLLHDLQDLRPTIVIDNHTFHLDCSSGFVRS